MIVPFAVVLKLIEVPCAVSVQFSDALTNMPPRVPAESWWRRNPRAEEARERSPFWTAEGAADVPRALLPTNKEPPVLLPNVLVVTCSEGVPDVALLTSRSAAGEEVPMPTDP